MRKYLEVLVDEDGKFHFSTEEPFSQTPSPKEFARNFKRLMQDMTEFMWRNKDQKVSQAIRSLAMAEILGGAQPYEMAEEFWSMMMFDVIPLFEKEAAAIKKPYGLNDPLVTRPKTFFPGTSVFPVKQPWGKKSN